tara:strand:+ start:199 stop:384 length:186 start_codon:yes stop_codon:yes gene_type:complete
MTKSETREISKTRAYAPTLGADYAARVLSMLYRAARTTRSQMEILAVALEMGVTSHAEFII